jgi:putative transport protein
MDVARLRESITGFLTEFPIVTLFGVIGIGYLLGEIRILGFRLGVAGVLFAGLAVGALGPGVVVPSIVSTFGLILFIYTIGIQFGPTFVSPFRRQTHPDAVFCVAMLVLGAGLALAVEIWNRSGATLAGLYPGALTNASALAAAQEVLRDNQPTLPAAALQQLVDQAVIAFGIAYPFGVLGVMLSFRLYRSLFGIQPAATEAGERIEVRDFVVQNPRVTGQRLGEILRLHKDLGFVVSRIQHNGATTLATADSRLALDDIVAVVGHRAALERAHHLFGDPAKVHIEGDRNVLDYRRVFVSSRDCVGKRIGDLNLPQQLSATITRLRRGDLDFVPNPATRLEFGDRIHVLTSPANFAAVSQFFGDSIRGTAEINFGSVGLGMTLGVILGLIPIPLRHGAAARPCRRTAGRGSDAGASRTHGPLHLGDPA